MAATLVEAVGLRKSFGTVEALRGIDLVADSGQVLALLGPNGAGKTTFVRMLATLLLPDAGQLMVTGLDVVRQAKQVRGVIGLAGQHAAVEPAMTGRENLEMVARLFDWRCAIEPQRHCPDRTLAVPRPRCWNGLT